jgi:FtsP/CotA-like multicopper oxidase with cupredoxin domain/plastocyanin
MKKHLPILSLFTIAAFLIVHGIAYAQKTVTVYVYNNEFSINPPGEAVVQAVIVQGDFIRWLHVQGNHTTTSVAGSAEVWNVPINNNNKEYTKQFNSTGLFWYYCIPHGSENIDGTASGMAGTITVLPAGSGACCLPDGSCVTTTEGECAIAGGVFKGIGSLCETSVCPIISEFSAVKDNILYESIDGTISNALGNHIYAGNNATGKRRGVLSFDVSTLPTNAEILDVELRLYCNSNVGASFPITLQRLSQNWGEGTSQATGGEATGVPATTGDATWLHTFYNTQFWNIPGGSFSSTISATTNVNALNTSFTWSSEQMKADIEHWREMPSMNYGWVIRGDEVTTNNPKRFASRHTETIAQRPVLKISYIIPQTGACCYTDGSCAEGTEMECMMGGGVYKGDGTTCAEVSCTPGLTPFLDPLPLPGIATPVTGAPGDVAHYRIRMTEQFQQLHSQLPPTRVWGYDGSYPGPTIEASRNKKVTVEWVNDLRVYETGQLRTTHALPIDECLHGPDKTGQVPVAIVHLHGGKVGPESDGHPDDAFPPGQSSPIYEYPNIQPAGTLWYHDHALGITRLNVMMGLAGLYTLRDDQEKALNIPKGEYEVPLVIQDRSFNADGSFSYPESWSEHFFGNVILVNGKVWPYLNVKQGKYRFRVVNGSNSRAYTLSLDDHSEFYQIGTELGLMNSPHMLHELTLTPGERAEIVIDFSQYTPGTEIILSNSAPAPFPGFPGVGVIPNVMKFIVQGTPGHTAPIPMSLVTVEELKEDDAIQERKFELKQVPGHDCGDHGHLMWTINGLMWDDITEYPVLGTTEIWTWHNQSGIAHPMHMHLVAFQILDRQELDPNGNPIGPRIPPDPSEKGWKDTANSPPGYQTRVIARFEGFKGLFPYHCHILEHEDHEMMRQFLVVEEGQCQDATITFTACDRYEYNGVAYTESGIYTQQVVDEEIGCRTTLTINLTINQSSASTSEATACDSYEWNSITYTASGTYVFTTLNQAGCDSTATLILTINSSTISSTDVTACDTYTWNETTYSTSGVYTFSTINAVGCDSVATLNLTIHKSNSSELNEVACDKFTLNGIVYEASGQYFQTLPNLAGCDSTIMLNLTILPSGTVTVNETACDSYTFNDITYTESGTYTQEITNEEGCSGTIVLNLVITKSTISNQSVTACNSYSWNGIPYTATGIYVFQTKNAVGCDSTATLNLTINTSTTSSQSVTACDTYLWNGITYTATGVYTFTTVNAAGCDSTAVLNLTLNKSTNSSQSVTACDQYVWNGNTYTTSGTYTFTTTNAAGCDSTATLVLALNFSDTTEETTVACDSYTWNGTTYTASGTYVKELPNANGCTTTATLKLTINNATSSMITETACNTFTLNGEAYTASGQYLQVMPNAVGCDSTITLNLTIETGGTRTITASTCNTYTLYGQTYSSSGTYTQFVPGPGLCDSVLTLNLTVIQLSKTVAMQDYVLSAQETGGEYQWFNCAGTVAITGATSRTYTVTESGEYSVRIRKDNCEVISACIPVTIVGLENQFGYSTIAYPNPTTGKVSIPYMKRNVLPSVKVVNGAGQSIDAQTDYLEDSIQVDLLSTTPGVYFIEVRDNDVITRYKVMKQ